MPTFAWKSCPPSRGIRAHDGLEYARISEIIRGRRAITGDTALRLGHWFGAAPQFWINLQISYDLRRAAEQAGQAIEKLPTRSDTPSPPTEPQPAFL
jgi:plasmid maintenance system antidote protein VapI